MGITQATLDRAAARGVAAAADVRDLTRDEAAAIYRAFYWDRYGCGRIVWPASLAVFDTAVQHGRAALLIQRALCDVGERVIIDGLWGPRTAAAAERAARRDAVQRRLRYAHVGRAAGVVGIVDVAAFEAQHEAERPVPVRHCKQLLFQTILKPFEGLSDHRRRNDSARP